MKWTANKILNKAISVKFDLSFGLRGIELSQGFEAEKMDQAVKSECTCSSSN